MSGRRIIIADPTNLPVHTITNTMVDTEESTNSMLFSFATASNTLADTRFHDTNEKKSAPSNTTIHNSCIDIRSGKSTNFIDKITQNVLNNVHVDKAINIYNKVKSFDNTIDEALGTFSKKIKEKSVFGKTNKHYSFLRVPSFDNILLFIYKSGYCSYEDTEILLSVHPLYYHLYVSISRSTEIDFTTLFHSDPDWESQASIPFSKS